MKRILIIILIGTSLSITSCFNDLDLEPPFGVNTTTVYEDPENYINVLAKIYAGLATTGNSGPAGSGDISGIDEGFSQYIRILWNLNVLTTDEAVCAWNDPGIADLTFNNFNSLNPWFNGMYSRIFFQVVLCNEFIRESSESKMDDRGFSQTEKEIIRLYRNEARFIRALAYYHAIDLFGNVPFVTEADKPGSNFPPQINRADLFDYVESELLEIEDDLIPARMHEYARADQAAVWSVLAKLYLNAEVYINTPKYTECLTYCNKIIDAGYTLEPEYTHLFLTDNHLSNEIIFPVTFEGDNTQTYGGTTFLTHAPVGGTMVPADYGINTGWAGYRATPEFVDIYEDTTDGRYLFYKDGQQKDITERGTFSQGYAIEKFKNISSTGVPGVDVEFVDTDFPLFRLADFYLMYAEAVLRGGAGGDMATAINYINLLRVRSFGNSSQNVSMIDLPFIIDERAKELFWEAHRRTDLIRFGLFTSGSYVWTFKGGDAMTPQGSALPSHFKLFPLPQADVVANTNLQQNPGY
ncbi:MAG: RagB/SusD family nutrient uptake outer membrane protein [Chitinophagales bacterium]|nr:RagB/SusD family nutrient uptake outer membrane protein [Chitinophagales bacterium]